MRGHGQTPHAGRHLRDDRISHPDDGRVAASTRYRDWDGKLRRVQATAGRGLPPGAEGALCHGLAFGLAVRHEVLPRNPMDHVPRLRRPPSTPTALSAVEVNAVRAAIAHWERGL